MDSNKIHVSETATDKVPNATATVASISSDLMGMAVMVCYFSYLIVIFIIINI